MNLEGLARHTFYASALTPLEREPDVRLTGRATAELDLDLIFVETPQGREPR